MQQTQSASRMPHSRSAYLAKSVPRPISLSLVLRAQQQKPTPAIAFLGNGNQLRDLRLRLSHSAGQFSCVIELNFVLKCKRLLIWLAVLDVVSYSIK